MKQQRKDFFMFTIQKYLLISSILFGHLSNTMNSNFNDFSNDYIKLVIPYLHNQPSFLNKSPDEQINPLKYFYTNIVHFASVNKRINSIVNNFLSKNISYQNLIHLHKEKELTLFYCPCEKNEKLYYVEVNLHFEKTYWNNRLLKNTHNYALILRLHTYDTSAKHKKLITDMSKIWVQKSFDSYYVHTNYLKYCVKYIISQHRESEKIQENSIDTIKEIIENITTLNNIITKSETNQMTPSICSFKFLEKSTLYTLPLIYCQFFEPFTWDLFCQLITLKYDARVNNVTNILF